HTSARARPFSSITFAAGAAAESRRSERCSGRRASAGARIERAGREDEVLFQAVFRALQRAAHRNRGTLTPTRWRKLRRSEGTGAAPPNPDRVLGGVR